LPAERALFFLKQAAAALQKAHSNQLIHRDVKPNNMIACSSLSSCDHLKLVDFGLVRDAERMAAGGSMTQEDFLQGTPSFMSPEQVSRSSAMDQRSDIYSLGAVAYFLLTGSPPFVRATSLEVLMAHLHDAVTPPTAHCPTIPADLEAIVLRCLEKNPVNRFQSAEEVAENLSRCPESNAWTSEEAAKWWLGKESDHSPKERQ
jgi:eukaryotic-like serine/threonine-protein kinase